MDSWIVVTSRFFINLVEYSQVTSQWAWQLNQSRQGRYTMTHAPGSRRWSGTHFWIACSRSYSRAVCFVFWPLPRPLSLRGQPHSQNTGESQERHELKTVPLLKLGQPWRGSGEEIENTCCVQRKSKVRLSGWITVQGSNRVQSSRKEERFWRIRNSTKRCQHRDWPG